MAIATNDNYITSAKQVVGYSKSAGRTTLGAAWYSLFDLAGEPGAGTLAGTSVAAGVVPDATVLGFPALNAFGGSALGYISRVQYSSSIACRFILADCLFKAGAYAFNAAQTLASQPSYSARMPGTNYAGTQIWIETVTAFTGNLSIAVTYTNQAGTAARTTGTVATNIAPTLGRMIQLPLQAGDTGVQKIESVTATVATVGTFNVLVLRPLWGYGRVRSINDGNIDDYIRTGLPQMFATSALFIVVAADGGSSGIPDLAIEVANN